MYFIHLVPLYTLIYYFIVTHINVSLVNLGMSYKRHSWLLFRKFLNKIHITVIIFILFSSIFILLDDTKLKFGNFHFSFGALSSRIEPVHLNSETSSLFSLFITLIIPVLFLLLPIFVLGLLFRNNLLKVFVLNIKSPIDMQAFTKDILTSFRNKFNLRNYKLIWSIFVSYIPLIFYSFFLLGLLSIFLVPLVKGSMALGYLDLNLWVEFILILIKAYPIALAIFVLTLLIYSIKSIRTAASIVLLCFALLPTSIIGYTIAFIFPSWHIFNIGIREVICYFLSFGIFSFYFITISEQSWLEEKKLISSYKLNTPNQTDIFTSQIRHPLNLSVIVISVLILNDFDIINSVGATSGEIQSYAHKLALAYKNTAKETIDNFAFIINAFLLAFANVIYIVLAPYVYGVNKQFGLGKTVQSIIEWYYQNIKPMFNTTIKS